jgi:hypothetical protein
MGLIFEHIIFCRSLYVNVIIIVIIIILLLIILEGFCQVTVLCEGAIYSGHRRC